jgi:cyclomaltodextrinase / maltogenic alpha-amylase / neopullulanase
MNDMHARPSSEWVKNAVIFEVDLRSFSNDGPLKKLEARIPELKKLGMTVISLMPIHPIGELNRRGTLGSPYAVRDFFTVNPEFGTLEDLTSLVATVHEQGLKIIINLVASQAAWDNQLLLEHPDWFVHNEEGAIVSPDYENSDAAQIDYHQHEPRKYMIAVMKFWIQEIDLDGFQCRSAELIPTEFWDAARDALEKVKPVMMISEGMSPEHHTKAFDLTCSWNMNEAVIDIIDRKVPASIIDDSLNAESLRFPKGSLHTRRTIKHDDNREDTAHLENVTPQVETAVLILAFTLPGVPLVSSGDGTGGIWGTSIFNKNYEALRTLRQHHPALWYGSYRNVQNSDSSFLFSFLRFSEKDSILIVVNLAHKKKEAEIQIPAGAALTWKDLFSGMSVKVKNSQLSVAVSPFGYLALIPSSEKESL